MAMRVIIVGGVAGGAAAATRIRRLDEHAEIMMFERGDVISFANCGLPYYIGGIIAERESLLVQTVDAMKARYNIDVRINQEVTELFPGKKEVSVKNRLTGEIYTESYDYLLLSPGAEPLIFDPALKTNPAVFSLRTMQDADAIKAAVDGGVKTAVVVGGGFIGIEIAENLCHRGVSVTVVEKLPDILTPFDSEMSTYLRQHMKAKGVQVLTGQGFSKIISEHGQNKVVLDTGAELMSDIVIMGVGVRPESELAKNAGLDLTERGAILVNDHLRTSDRFIYAVGDAVALKNRISGNISPVALAGPAAKYARIAAGNICGRDEAYDGVIGTCVLKVFDLSGAATGLNERQLKLSGIPYQKCYISGSSHAGYYPGAQIVALKLLFAPDTGHILGAQAIGPEGADKRIDVLATAIYAGMTVRKLKDVELCYAPPFGTAKDIVNTAAYVACNMLDGLNPTIEWDELAFRDPEKTVLLDVRTKEEYDLRHIPGSVFIPLDELRGRMDELPKEKELLIVCRSALRGYLAGRILTANGFKARNLNGGYRIYQAGTCLPESTEDLFWD